MEPQVFKEADKRTSAKVLSGGAVAMLVSVVVMIVILDAPRLVEHFWNMNCKRRCQQKGDKRPLTNEEPQQDFR